MNYKYMKRQINVLAIRVKTTKTTTNEEQKKKRSLRYQNEYKKKNLRTGNEMQVKEKEIHREK